MKKDKVLFTIDGEPTYVSEFSRVYKKNLDIIDKKDQKEIEEYFDVARHANEVKALGWLTEQINTDDTTIMTKSWKPVFLVLTDGIDVCTAIKYIPNVL